MPRIRPMSTAPCTSARLIVVCALAIVAGASCGGGASTAVIPVTALRFSVQPTSVAAGATFSVTVELDGAAGTRATSAVDPVTIAVVGGGTISGPATVGATGGVAKFNGLSMALAGTNLQLVATSGLLSTTSTAFTVLPGAADLAHSDVSPAPGNVAPNVTTALTFTFRDAYSNPLPSATVSITSNLAAAVFTPSSGTTDSTGRFTTNLKSTAQGSATITATVGGKQLAFATPYVVVDLCPPSPMTFPGSITGAIPSGVCVINSVRSAVYAFTMPSAGGASFTVTAAFAPLFEVKPGPGLTDVQLQAQSNSATIEWLLPSGPLQFALGAPSGAGAYTITGAAVPANSGCAFRMLVAPGTYAGQSLASGDCVVFYGDSSYTDEYLMLSPNPCTLTVRTNAFENYFSVFDYNDLYNSTGALPPLGVSHPALGADAVIQLPACQSGNGPIDIVVNSFSQGETGPYTLIVAMQGPQSVRAVTISAVPRKSVAITGRDVARMLRVAAVKRRRE